MYNVSIKGGSIPSSRANSTTEVWTVIDVVLFNGSVSYSLINMFRGLTLFIQDVSINTVLNA